MKAINKGLKFKNSIKIKLSRKEKEGAKQRKRWSVLDTISMSSKPFGRPKRVGEDPTLGRHDAPEDQSHGRKVSSSGHHLPDYFFFWIQKPIELEIA